MKTINQIIRDLRKDYNQNELLESTCREDPFEQFELWMHEAIEKDVDEPNAMNLATVDSDGNPSSRIVLLRNVDDNGFVFFTNYLSKKGNDIDAKRPAAINFFWPKAQRQIRIEGICERIEEWDSEDYFNTRPRESKIGALASKQSQQLESREHLEQVFDDLSKQYKDKDVVRPEHWGGYRLIPNYFEYWQGRLSRLHDRLAYNIKNDKWILTRLYP